MKFLYNAPAVLLNNALIIGDTHFGMEKELLKKGIYDSMFSMRLAERVIELVKRVGAEEVVFLGDVKDEIGGVDEKSREALEAIRAHAKITVIKGNHDGGIEEIDFINVVESSGEVRGEVGLIHGHAWPKEEIFKCKYIISGHQHPTIEIKDAFGKRHSEAVWAFVPPNKKALKERGVKGSPELILIPAFNPLVGYPLNNPKEEHLGPLLNNNLFKLKDALIYRLNGTPLGVLKELK